MKRSHLRSLAGLSGWSAVGLALTGCWGEKLDLGGDGDSGTRAPAPVSIPIVDGGYPPDAPSVGPVLEAGPDSPPPPPASAWLAFDSNRGGARGIYLIRSDGTGLTRVTAAYFPQNEVEPAFSPEGTRLAFTATEPNTHLPQIYVRNLVTGLTTELTSRPYGAHQPAWSPDGSLIAYVAIPEGAASSDAGTAPQGSADLYVISPDGTGEKDVTGSVGPAGTLYPDDFPATPTFGRDSKTIFFSCTESIYSIGVDGTGLRQISEGPTEGAETPTVSWDGTQVAFSKWNVNGEAIYEVASAGYPPNPGIAANSSLIAQGPHTVPYRRPAWGASNVLAFEEDFGPTGNIYLVPAAGGTPTALSSGPNDDRNPTWAPPGFVPTEGSCPSACQVLSTNGMECSASATLCDCSSPAFTGPVPAACEAFGTSDAGAVSLYCCN
jgi:TolB protein